MTHDYAKMSMEFEWEDKIITPQGETSLEPQPISFHQLQVLVSTGDIHGMYELLQLSGEPEIEGNQLEPKLPNNIPELCQQLLKKIVHLFEISKFLPPYRLFDHKIHLSPGSKPVNVRPYRYPHYQKDEMEKLVKEMMEQGVIRPSQSPFSSPVLLVKKNGTYRFCVDYRALNAITVRDNFPIPTTDELFDELGGAVIFSKLDLRAGYH